MAIPIVAPPSTSTSVLPSATPLAKIPIKRFAGHRGRVESLAWNCDGRRLASGSQDKTVKVWLPEKDGRSATEMKGHTSQVTGIKWDPTHPELLVSCSSQSGVAGDKGLNFWDLRQAKPTSIVQTQGENLDINWSPDGKTIILGNRKDTTLWIDVDSKKVTKEIANAKETNQSVFSHDGALIYQAYDNGINITSFPTNELVHSFKVAPVSAYAVDLDPRGRYLATASIDALITLWETGDFTCVRSIGWHDEPIRNCLFSHDGRFLASSSNEGQAIITEVPSGKKAHSIAMNACPAIAWHPNRTILAYSSDEGRAMGGFAIWGM